jgi:hypothetical protein
VLDRAADPGDEQRSSGTAEPVGANLNGPRQHYRSVGKAGTDNDVIGPFDSCAQDDQEVFDPPRPDCPFAA